MENNRIGIDQINNTGVALSIEGRDSNTWEKSAELAMRIANDPECQGAMIQSIHLIRKSPLSPEQVEATSKAKEMVLKKFGNEQYFDAGVETAALLAVISWINEE